MSSTEAPEVPVCIGCGRTLIIRGEYTICPTEDGVQAIETTPGASTFAQEEVVEVDGAKINNPFGVNVRLKTMFDRMHDSRFTAQKREWYGK